MRSVLVIDKPKCCDECDLCYMQDDIYKDNGNHLSLFCPIVGWMDIELGRADIHEKCPLRDLPSFQVANEYDFETYTNGISIGWNRCLEKVTGEVPDYAKTKGYEGAEIRANKGESGE